MTKRFIVLFMLLTSSESFGQAQTIFPQQALDSLWLVWQDETKTDSLRLEALSKYSWHSFVFSQPDSAYYYAQIQHDFAEKVGAKMYTANALMIKGTSFWVKGDYTKALEYFERELIIERDINYKPGIAGTMNKLGIVYDDLGNKIKALDYFQKSLKLRTEIGDKHKIVYTLNSIGDLYNEQGNTAKALEYFHRCLKIREEFADSVEIAFSLSNIGKTFLTSSDYDSALYYCKKSLKLGEKFGKKRDIALTLANLGDIFKNTGQATKAMDHYAKSLKLQEEIGSKPKIAELLANIGKLYHSQKAYQRGNESCKRSYEISLELGDIYKQKRACECLYNGYKALNNDNQALEYHEKMLVLNDSLKSEETAKRLQQMEFAKTMLNDSIAKAEEARLISIAHQEEVRKKNQIRNISIGVGVLILFLAMLLYSRLKYVRKSKATLQVEKDRSENLLLNILPKEIAQELKDKGKAEARDFDCVSILFTDFKSFTQASAKLSAQELVTEINTCFEAFDEIIGKHGIEKIKTIGDAYMAAGGLPITSNESAKNTILAALDMQAFITNRIAEKQAKNEIHFEMRLGVHTGPIVAGIVGVKKFQYDIWGDTVNIASRMESSSEVGKVNISQSTYDLIKNDPQFAFQTRGKIHAKGKGDMEMYFVEKVNLHADRP